MLKHEREGAQWKTISNQHIYGVYLYTIHIHVVVMDFSIVARWSNEMVVAESYGHFAAAAAQELLNAGKEPEARTQSAKERAEGIRVIDGEWRATTGLQ